MSLFEVLIAFGIFSVFYTVFISSQTDNKLDSIYMEKDLKLHNLTENILNDILFAPPKLTKSLLLSPQKSSFEDSELSDYEYMVEYKEFEIPNIFAIDQENNEDQDEGAKKNNQYLGLIFEQVKENIKENLWQVRVTVTDKVEKYSYSLSAWIKNPEAEIKTEFAGIPNTGNTQ